MKRRQWFIGIACVALLVVWISAIGLARYRRRPFFHNWFVLVGEHGVLGWEGEGAVAFNDNRFVHYDIPDRVLFVAAVTPNRNVEWVVDGTPVNERDRLRLRRQEDGSVKEIEWRRDCIIYMNRCDSPRYVSLSGEQFDKAIAGPGSLEASVRGVVDRGERLLLPLSSTPRKQDVPDASTRRAQ